jgi:hypothetical protein
MGQQEDRKNIMDISLQDATIEKAAFPQGQIKFLARDSDYGLIESLSAWTLPAWVSVTGYVSEKGSSL